MEGRPKAAHDRAVPVQPHQQPHGSREREHHGHWPDELPGVCRHRRLAGRHNEQGDACRNNGVDHEICLDERAAVRNLNGFGHGMLSCNYNAGNIGDREVNRSYPVLLLTGSLWRLTASATDAEHLAPIVTVQK
jgi:hypothetical protein